MFIVEATVAAILEEIRPDGDLDFSLFGWEWGAIDPDASSLLHSEGANNFARISNPRLDELIEQGLSIVDPEKRRPIYYEIQEIFVEEAPVLYLQIDYWQNLFSAKVKGLPEEALDGDMVYHEA